MHEGENMKTKIIAFLLLLAVSACSLSSCILLETDGILGSSGGNSSLAGDTTINVNGGPTYENINITSDSDKNLLSASKAVLSAVSVRTSTSAGSGVIYKLDKEKGEAFIITNYHVVAQNNESGISSEIKVYLYGMEATKYAIDATYVGGSLNYDIALLHVKDSTVLIESCARAADIADSDDVSILDTAIAVGNPEGKGISVTVGCVNVDSENIVVSMQGRSVQLRVMRTDAAVNSGNSGGGLFNDNGELIGVVNAKSGNSSTDNIGYAIPSNVAVAIADNIKYYCYDTPDSNKKNVYRCMMGVTVSASDLSTSYDTETGKIHKFERVVISEVSNTGAAYGKLQAGDAILAITINGEKHEVTRTHHLIDTMLNARVGNRVVIHVSRGGANVDVEIVMTESMVEAY